MEPEKYKYVDPELLMFEPLPHPVSKPKLIVCLTVLVVAIGLLVYLNMWG